MENMLWPGDHTQKQIALLAPSDKYSIRLLTNLRLVAAIYFTVHVSIIVLVTFDEFWKYFTNLTYCLVMPAY
jgi:hypothetical protein